jgi:hypothetical protein
MTFLNKKLEYSWPPTNVLLEFYTTSLPSSITIFVKREAKNTLDETIEETLDVEMEMTSIVNKVAVEDRRALPPTNRVTLKDEKKDKEALDFESLQKLVKSLTNDILDIKKNVAK